MRRAARALFGFVLRIFFRRLEIAGLERLPATGPAVLVLNHPSALVDPLLVLSLVPRRAAFLAKSTLFSIPVVSWFVRAFDSIPVYRKQDGADLSQNRLTFEAARAVLSRGGVLALFPEGASHDEPHLLPLKTGAARIALGAASGGGEPLRIVPAGLTFADKGTFRSDALLLFGESFAIAGAPLDERGEPPAAEVHALTRKIEDALSQVVLQADRDEALALVARAESIFSASDADAERLSRQFELRRQFLEGWARLRTLAPEQVARTERQIRRYESALAQSGLSPSLVDPRHFRLANVASVAARTLGFLGLLAPLALVGAVLHAPAYLLVDRLARRLSHGDASMLATLKVIAALLFYPATWAALSVIGAVTHGVAGALAAPALAAATAWAALRFFEELDWLSGAARALALFVFRRRAFVRLADERARIRQSILALAALLEPPPAS